VGNAIELINHLQVCAPALRNTTHLQAVLNGEMDLQDDDLPSAPTDLGYCGVETAPGYGEVHFTLNLIFLIFGWIFT